MQVELRQDFLDFVERLAPEERRAQHLGFRLLDQFADEADVVVPQAVGRPDGELELLDEEEHPVVNAAVPVPSKPLFLASYVDGRADLQHAAGQRPGDVDLSTAWLATQC
jgi:hypothetical protein